MNLKGIKMDEKPNTDRNIPEFGGRNVRNDGRLKRLIV